MRCRCCGGSEKMMGAGMLTVDCTACVGGHEVEQPPIDKRSKLYKESIAKIMAADDCDKETAERSFEEAYNKV
jgi:hypothetical protein